MENDVLVTKSWWSRYWKWVVGIDLIVLILAITFFSSGFGDVLGDYSKAYADPALYDGALEQVRGNDRVFELLGELKPIDNTTILNGDVQYSDKNMAVTSTIKIVGKKGPAQLDIAAMKVDGNWVYQKITVRIKQPTERKETINVLTLAD